MVNEIRDSIYTWDTGDSSFSQTSPRRPRRATWHSDFKTENASYQAGKRRGNSSPSMSMRNSDEHNSENVSECVMDIDMFRKESSKTCFQGYNDTSSGEHSKTLLEFTGTQDNIAPILPGTVKNEMEDRNSIWNSSFDAITKRDFVQTLQKLVVEADQKPSISPNQPKTSKTSSLTIQHMIVEDNLKARIWTIRIFS
jgi:hypothetical protein